MNLSSMFKKNYIVGLDIGSSSVKIAQFRKTEGRFRLVKCDLKEIKKTYNDQLREKEIVSALKSLFKAINIKKSRVIATINCPETAVTKVKTPYMPKGDLHAGIQLKAKDYFPFPTDNSLLDFEILGDIVERGLRKYEVAVAVSPRKTVDKYLLLLRKAGIKPLSLVPALSALQKLVTRPHYTKNDVVCFADIGQSHTELIICRGRELLFSRKIPVSGSDFTKAMTGVLVSDRGKTALSLDEAEKIKRETGIPPADKPEIIEDKVSTTQILSMLRTPLEHMVNEIERCFDYCREETGGGRINYLVLFGGGAALRGLIGFLSESLGMEVKLGDPLEGFEVEPGAIRARDKISYRLGLAIGAALSKVKGINLLPPEIKEETKRVFKRATAQAIITALILISALVYIGMKIQLSNFQKRISVAGRELSGLQPQFRKAEAYHLANMVFVDEPHWEDVFRELSNILPEDIHFTDIRMKDDIITMRGIVSSEKGEQLLSDFIFTLEKGIFKNVNLVRTKDLKEAPGTEFELKCWVD